MSNIEFYCYSNSFVLYCFGKMHKSVSFDGNNNVWKIIEDMNTKVSVIIPVYKVESFIERCVISLMKQTMKEGIEYIFVDDATPDRSCHILNKVINSFPERSGQIRILHHDKNQGLPSARNTGLAVAAGKYIFHCDSDDYVEPTMLETLVDYAEQKRADIVWCDWFLTFAQNERYMKQPSYMTPFEALKAMLSGAMKYNVWNKLVRRDLYMHNHINFPSGYGMGEDMTMMMLFACARKVSYLNQAFYHYVKTNTCSFSQVYSERHIAELQYNVQRLVIYLNRKYGNALEKEIAFFKLETKFPFLIMTNSKVSYTLWNVLYSEANDYIWANNTISFRNRFIQWCAWKKQFWIVRLYYYVVIRFVYGVIFH